MNHEVTSLLNQKVHQPPQLNALEFISLLTLNTNTPRISEFNGPSQRHEKHFLLLTIRGRFHQELGLFIKT